MPRTGKKSKLGRPTEPDVIPKERFAQMLEIASHILQLTNQDLVVGRVGPSASTISQLRSQKHNISKKRVANFSSYIDQECLRVMPLLLDRGYSSSFVKAARAEIDEIIDELEEAIAE